MASIWLYGIFSLVAIAATIAGYFELKGVYKKIIVSISVLSMVVISGLGLCSSLNTSSASAYLELTYQRDSYVGDVSTSVDNTSGVSSVLYFFKNSQRNLVLLNGVTNLKGDGSDKETLFASFDRIAESRGNMWGIFNFDKIQIKSNPIIEGHVLGGILVLRVNGEEKTFYIPEQNIASTTVDLKI